MTLNIIELQDHNLRINSDADGLLGQSPGFASTASTPPVFGTRAYQQMRLHPQDSFNRFWSSLSLDPLRQENPHFRHQADIAFGHLQDLEQDLGLGGEVIFAVPSHYSNKQLGTLLGLSRHCSFDVVGLVDLPLLTLGDAAQGDELLYVDIQLHQCVLTRFSRGDDDQLQRDKVLQVPGCGLLALHDAWSNLIAEAFVKQSRFNPHHTAETEQHIINCLPDWLAQVSRDKEITLEINSQGTVHQAKLNLSAFEQRAQTVFRGLAREIAALAGPGTRIHLPRGMSALPGFARAFPESIALDEARTLENGLQHLSKLTSKPDALKLVTRLPGSPRRTAAGRNKAGELPTHLLYRHKAYRLPGPGESANGDAGIKLPGLTETLSIRVENSVYVLEASADTDLRLNGKALGGRGELKIGDRISLGDSGESLELIQVQ